MLFGNVSGLLNSELARNIEDTIPFVALVLVGFGGDEHFRQTIPTIDEGFAFIEADLPGVRAGADVECGKAVTEFVEAGVQIEIVGSPGPDE